MKKIWIVLLAIAMVGVSGCGLGRGESGTHRGMITDVSQAGWFCKTWEGQIQSGNGNSAMHYDFTVQTEAVAKQLEAAQKSGQEVIVHYDSPVVYSLCYSDHANIVTAVEPYTGK
jgi:hypothetical protein